MNLPDFVLMIPGETVALIALLALVCAVAVAAHYAHPPKVDLSGDRDALEELGR